MTQIDAIKKLEAYLNIDIPEVDNIEWNDIGYVKDKLGNITELGLNMCKIENIDFICEILIDLPFVVDLYLRQNCITNINPLINVSRLEGLFIGHNLIEDISPLQYLKNLNTLNLDGNKITNIDSLKNLKKMRFLDLDHNNIISLKSIEDLVEITSLYIVGNKVKTLRPLYKLLNIKIFDASNNLIKDLNPIKHLTKMEALLLSGNEVRDIKPLIYLKKIINLDISNNKIQEPSLEIIEQGIDAIRIYFQEKEKQGEQKLHEAKIVIVGAGESGKTTLIKKLLNPEYPVPNLEDKRTEGIKINTYSFEGKLGRVTKKLNAHIWDFGGQELYHTTHQLFLTPDTLYILLNDNRKNDTDFYYWLNIVTLRAGINCPILMVFNEKDNATRQIVPGDELYKAFGNLIHGAIDVNFADKDLTLVNRMKERIEKHFIKLDVLGKAFPAYWVNVRKALGEIGDEHISWQQFVSISNKNEINDIPQIKILAKTLHNLGVILFFPDVFGLEDLIILKPQWCIDAIYSALDTKEIIKNAGRFNENLLAKKWAGTRFSGNHLELLKLMQHFDLCYPVEGTKDFIAPQLLDIKENKYPDFPEIGSIVYRFEYTFMPAGMLTRLIARMSRNLKTPFVWRNGVTLEWEDDKTIAEIIENQFSRQIIVRLNGKEKKRRLHEVRKNMYDIHKAFRGLKFDELVSCNCKDCIKSILPTTYKLKELEEDAVHNDEVTCRNVVRKKILATNILEGIEYKDKPRIFISYSHQNEKFKNEFRAMISPMERENHWKVWDDCWLLPSDIWNKEILRHFSEANVIVLMLTKEFFDSDYIYDIEMTRAIQRHESGDALVIGIIVSDCLWEQTPLKNIQMIPNDGKPVVGNTNRNKIWKAVASKINETILIRERTKERKGGWE